MSFEALKQKPLKFGGLWKCCSVGTWRNEKFLFSSNFSLMCFLVRSLRQLKAVVPFVKRQRYAPITPALAMFLYVAVHIDLKWKTIEDYAVVCLKLLRGKRDIHH